MKHIIHDDKFGCYQENLSIKNISSSDSIIHGYASVFDVVDGHNDIVLKGAFADTIKNFESGRIIPILWQHQEDKPIGLIERVEEDEYGLYVSARILNDVWYGKEAMSLIKSQVICGFSIGYNVLSHKLDYETDTRFIYKIDLWEISIVTFPANKSTIITAIN
jgi:uncharacterized protein